MSTVSKFMIDGTEIAVEDSTARTNANNAAAQVSTLTGEVNKIKALSRLTVNYTSETSTITFDDETHA